MNAEDLVVLRGLIARTVDLVNLLRHLAAFGTIDVEGTEVRALRAELAGLRCAVGEITDAIQDRESRSWGRTSHVARKVPPPRLSKPLAVPTTFTAVPVQRFTMQGRPVAEKAAAPAPSGQWSQGRLGRPKPRKVVDDEPE